MKTAKMNDIEKRLEIMMGLCRETIPARFYRSFADEPFDACEYCHKPLRMPGTRYTISKYYAANELRQEIAVCRDCSSKLKEGYSQESLLTIKKTYNDEYVSRRLQILFQATDTGDRTALMTSACSLCQTPKEQIAEYLEYALCEGEDLVYYTHPSIVCAQCTIQLYNSLSVETKDHKRRFFQKQFGYPPPGASADELMDSELGLWSMA